MGVWRTAKATSAAVKLGTTHLEMLALIGKHPNDVFLSHFHIAYLLHLVRHSVAIGMNIGPHDIDLEDAMTAALKNFVKRFYSGDRHTLDQHFTAYDEVQVRAGQTAAELFLRAQMGDDRAIDDIRKLLPKRNAEFVRAAQQAGIDFTDLAGAYHSLVFLDTLPVRQHQN